MTPRTTTRAAEVLSGPLIGRRPDRPPLDGRSASRVRPASAMAFGVAGLSLAAALIHLWVIPEHFLEWWGYGAFFVACVVAQGLFGVLLLRQPEGQLLALTGIWGNVAIVAMYVVTRTYGIPLGPYVGHMEDPGVLGMAATAAEVGIVFALVAVLRGAWRRWTVNALLLLGAATWALRFAGILP